MGAGNVAVVEAINEALNRGDLEAAAAQLDPDFEADFSRSRNPDIQGVHRGRDQVRTLLERIVEPWEEFEWTTEEYIEVGDAVVRVGGFRARGKGSGLEIEGRGAQVWEFRDGRAVAMHQFQDKDEALEATSG
jgi:ketosteroid isomerase-like protein